MRSLPLVLLVLAGCPGEVTNEFVCSDPRYGNGTCELEAICGVTDVDCFMTFDSDTEATAWFQAREPAKVLLPPSDPRYQRLRALLDRGWVAYQATNDVGMLAAERPSLVIVDDPQLNAFVTTDTTSGSRKSVLSVQFFTGLLTLDPTDDELLAVIMHELEHAIALHPFPETKARLWKYYPATPEEPLGFLQPDDPVVRMHVEQWRALSEDAGHFVDIELAGMPYADGSIMTTFKAIIELMARRNPAGCQANITELNAAYVALQQRYVGLDQSLTVEGTNIQAQLDTALARFRDQCMAGVPDDYIAAHAAVHRLDEATYRASLPVSDRMLVEGKPFVNGMYALVFDRRAKMRQVQQSFATATGLGWSRVRYFTTEEAADDALIAVLDDMAIDPAVAARILPRLMGLSSPSLPVCYELLDSGQVPPYGENLLDDHHSDCWRAHNIKALATSTHTYSNNGRTVSLSAPFTPPWTVHVPMMKYEPPYEIMY
jgi:hypothetical protein